MRREERVTVQGPVQKQQPDGMSHRGACWAHLPTGPTPLNGALFPPRLYRPQNQIQALEEAGLKVQNFLNRVATVLEQVASLFAMDDVIITSLCCMATVALLVGLWVLPLQHVAAALGLFLLRPPRFRTPTPPPPISMLLRLPDKGDQVIYAKKNG